MKSTLALLALMSILTFGIPANVLAALTASTGVSPSQITMINAKNGVTTDQIEITSNSEVYLSFRIADSGNQEFLLNSVTIDITVNDVNILSTQYNSYNLAGSIWNRVGFYGSNSYTNGAMNQGSILIGWGNINSSDAYITSINPGDIWRADISYDVQDQGVIHSVGTVTYIPEPTSLFLVGVSALCFLRRKRV